MGIFEVREGYCVGVVGMLCWVREGFLRDFWGVVMGV